MAQIVTPQHIYIWPRPRFSAYLLGKTLLKTGEKVHFSTKKKHGHFWSSFLFLPFSLCFLKMAKLCCFCLSKRQKGRQKTRPPPNIYIYMPDGAVWGPRFFQRTGRLGVHLRAGSGPMHVSHYKIGISEEKCGSSKRGKKSQIAHPMGQELRFVETHT